MRSRLFRPWLVPAVLLALLAAALLPACVSGEVGVGLLQGLADLATVEEQGPSMGWRLVSPFLYDLTPNIVADVDSLYPTRDYRDAEALSAICGYIEWVKATGNRSVIVFLTTFDWKDALDLLNDIDEISVDGRRFEPASLPVPIEIRRRTIDYTDCSCGEEGFIIYAIPMPPAFLDAVRAGTSVRFLIRGWRSSPGNAGRNDVASVFAVTRSAGLADYVRLLNGMAP